MKLRVDLSVLVALSLIALAVVAYAVWRGQDTNWDLRNYHYYGAWAFIHGRSFTDLWPAQVQSFFNPLASLLPYFLISRLPPIAAGAGLALIQGINVALVLAIALRLFKPAPDGGEAPARLRRWLVIGSAVVVGATAPMFVSEIGTTFPDSTTSIPVVAGVLALLWHVEGRRMAPVVICGLLFGVATGLKLTNGIYLLGAIAYPWWIQQTRADTLKTVVVFIGGALVGLIATHGYWSVELWQHFGSPLFPLYNATLQSPWFESANFNDSRFLPSSPLDAASYPFQWVLGLHPSSELAFRDARFAVAVVLAGAAFVAALLGSRRAIDPTFRQRRLVLAFTAASFVVWLALFGISRYLVPLELLSGIVLVSLLSFIARDRWLPALSVVLAVALVAWTVPANWGRRVWAGSWFGVAVPAELRQSNELFVMLGGDPSAYVIPFLPTDAHFVRLEGNLPLAGVPGRERLRDLAQATIEAHAGPTFTLARVAPSAEQAELLGVFGLQLTPGECVALETRLGDMVSCPLSR